MITYSTEILSKQLIRFLDEQKINKFVEEAEEERRNLEAVETGRRFAEKIIKSREQKMYSEILDVHRNFVIDMLDESVDFSSNFLTKKIAMEDTLIREKKF